LDIINIKNIPVLWPFQFQKEKKTNIKWDHFEILATGKSDLRCKIEETLLIIDLKPSLNENIGSDEKLFL